MDVVTCHSEHVFAYHDAKLRMVWRNSGCLKACFRIMRKVRKRTRNSKPGFHCRVVSYRQLVAVYQNLGYIRDGVVDEP
jgi:hypothetical protein